jgi:DNA-binding MarR family transcriptional regulator
MDALLFGLKRAHHATLRFGHEVLGRFGLTPARFDLLFAITTWDSGLVRQSALRRELGVARSTISRMLRSLEQLGFIRRTPRRYTRSVWLTRLGRFVTRRATRHTYRRGLARRAIDHALLARTRSERFIARDVLEGTLRSIRRKFGDVAELYYPWDPDD